ncbi:MAG: hypothetical protein ABJE66_04925 [Deltaproteobacteria bacterium]
MKMADLMCVELKLAVACMKCKASVPVNGPREVSRCAECDSDTPLTGALRWRELLSVRSPGVDVFKVMAPLKDGVVEKAEHDGITLTATRGWPTCTCGRKFESVKIAGAFANLSESVACPKCNKQLTIQRPPASFRADAKSVTAVVGAEVVPDGPPKPHLPRQAAGKDRGPWWAMFDRSLA